MRGPTTPTNASPELSPKTATATAIANSKLFPAAVKERGCGVGGDLPAVGCDFDNFTVGVGEIEEDNIWIAWIAAGGDAAFDGEVCSTAIGTCGEGANGLAKGVGAGRLVVVAVEGGDEPVADARRVN